MLKPPSLQKQNDKWHIVCGRLTRDQVESMLAWCHENWEGHWGELDHSFGNTVFILHKLEHANWFMLKYG